MKSVYKQVLGWTAAVVLLVPAVGSLHSANAVKAAAADWVANTTLPEPVDPDSGLPEYVPFSNALKTMTGSTASTQVLKTAQGNDIAAQITNKTKTQSGAIWSIDKLSLTKNFNTKMHIYFGTHETDSTKGPADGMAFALTGATPTKVYSPGAGLGVWRVDKSSPYGNDELPNSFVITFDTYYNGDGNDSNVMLPVGGPDQYVGWGFPAQPAQVSYENFKTHLLWDPTNSKDGGLSQFLPKGLGGYQALTAGQRFDDGKWHTVDVSWTTNSSSTDGGGTLKFSIDLGDGTNLVKSLTWTADQLKTIFGGTSVYWGFTGSTGDKYEDAVVTFENIPGLISASATAKATQTDGSAAPSSVYTGTELNQVYTLTYNGDQSKQDWPDQGNGTQSLSANLLTDSHYGFLVDAQGNVTLKYQVGKTKARTASATAVGAVTQTTDASGQTVYVAKELKVASLPGFLKANHQQSYAVTAPIIALSATAAGENLTGVNSGAIVGNNARFSTTVDLPTVEVLSLTVPYKLSFGTLTIAQLINGFTLPVQTVQTVDGGTLAKSAGIVAKIPSDASSTLTAQLSGFDMGTGYDPAKTNISFDYGGKHIVLQNGGDAATLFANTNTAPSPTITNMKLTMGPYPQAHTGSYSAMIEWTLQVGPKPQ